MLLSTGGIPSLGVLENLSNVAYHSHASLSHSLCRYLEPEMAPLQFWHRSWMNPYRVIDGGDATACLNTGKLMHMAMENMDEFQSTIALLPKVKVSKRPGFIGAAPGGQLEALLVLRAKLLAMPLVQQATAEGKPEVSIFASERDVPVRCRPDLMSPGLELHWKFTGRMERLGWVIDRYRYIEALAWYRRVRRLAGLAPARQIMIFCEVKAPYEIRTIEPSQFFLDEADIYGSRALMRFKHLCGQFGDLQWPDHRLTPQDVFTGSAGSPRNAIELPGSYDKRLAA